MKFSYSNYYVKSTSYNCELVTKIMFWTRIMDLEFFNSVPPSNQQMSLTNSK